ncbi:Transposase [Moraxella catarrhalis]|nr:Transposase [Moraxella catarrhalis]
MLQVKTFIQQHIVKQHGQDNIHFIRARDLWHLSHRFMRKILAYNFCFVINKQLGNPPFQFELLISS